MYDMKEFVVNNYYENANFRIVIRNDYPSFYSALLHEYIHFLQDTCTYFGVKLREDLYNNKEEVNTHLIQGCDIKCLGSFYGINSKEKYLPKIAKGNGVEIIRLGTSILGAKAIKENMAYVAQKYLYEDYNKHNSEYAFISNFVEIECPFLKNNNLIQFALDDISLMTENPGKALIKMIEVFKVKKDEVVKLCYVDKIKLFYDYCETILETNKLSQYNGIIDAVGGVEGHLYSYLPKEESNIDDIVHCIVFFCKNNYQQRLKKHSILSETLIDYKNKSINHLTNSNEESIIFQKIFFESFGYPVINNNRDKKMFNSNTLKDLGFINNL